MPEITHSRHRAPASQNKRSTACDLMLKKRQQNGHEIRTTILVIFHNANAP